MVEVLKFDTIMVFSLSSIQVDFLGNCFATPENWPDNEILVKVIKNNIHIQLTCDKFWVSPRTWSMHCDRIEKRHFAFAPCKCYSNASLRSPVSSFRDISACQPTVDVLAPLAWPSDRLSWVFYRWQRDTLSISSFSSHNPHSKSHDDKAQRWSDA